MHKEGPANRPAPPTPVIVNPSDEPGPSHSAFDRAEAIAVKQMKIVCIYPTFCLGFASGRLKTPQDLDALRKGFTKLRDKHRITTSALEYQLDIRENEIEQLTTQIATLQEELRMQAETAKNQVSALHIVRNPWFMIILHR